MTSKDVRQMAVGLWELVDDERYSELTGHNRIHLLLNRVRIDWEVTIEPTPEVIDIMFGQLVGDLAEYLELWKEESFDGYDFNEGNVDRWRELVGSIFSGGTN